MCKCDRSREHTVRSKKVASSEHTKCSKEPDCKLQTMMANQGVQVVDPQTIIDIVVQRAILALNEHVEATIDSKIEAAMQWHSQGNLTQGQMPVSVTAWASSRGGWKRPTCALKIACDRWRDVT